MRHFAPKMNQTDDCANNIFCYSVSVKLEKQIKHIRHYKTLMLYNTGPQDIESKSFNKISKNKPKLIIVMGVSGCGKSTLARAVAEYFNYRFLDADDYHSDEAKLRMSSGIPLTDEMRKPWVRSVCGHLRQLCYLKINCTLAFSGLKKEHRNKLRETGYHIVFLFLNGDKATIRKRMQHRPEHFMPAKLLDSQFDSLERPIAEKDVITIDIEPPLKQVTAEAISIAEEKLEITPDSE